jgi:hypothetical protein
MNYRIIEDEYLLRGFIDWLPELKDDEKYYISLFARSKYCKNSGLKNDKQQIRRTTSNKEFLYDKIKQMECEIGSYKQNGVAIPQESLVIYINPNPRSMELAAKKGVIELIKLTQEKYSGYNPYNFMLNFAQTCSKRKLFCNIDFDNVDLEQTKEKINNLINTECLTYLITRGGFHVLVEYSKIEDKYIKSWYKNIMSLDGVDVKGDELMPIPGTYQGGFIPYLESYEK